MTFTSLVVQEVNMMSVFHFYCKIKVLISIQFTRTGNVKSGTFVVH